MIMNYCWKCGNPVKPAQKFCAKCGAKLRGEEIEEKHIDKTIAGKGKLPGMNAFCLLLIIACAIVWFCTPLAKIEYVKTAPHPSGLFLLENLNKELAACIRSFTFWLEMLSLLGIIAGLFAAFFHKRRASSDYALISAFNLLFIVVFDLFRRSGNIDFLLSDFGWGFWTLLGLLIFTAIVNILLEKRTARKLL